MLAAIPLVFLDCLCNKGNISQQIYATSVLSDILDSNEQLHVQSYHLLLDEQQVSESLFSNKMYAPHHSMYNPVIYCWMNNRLLNLYTTGSMPLLVNFSSPRVSPAQ